jgi:hypothetical protein
MTISLFESFDLPINDYANSHYIDKIFNPNCYGKLDTQQKNIGPIMSSDIILCPGNKRIENQSLELEFLQDSTLIRINIKNIIKSCSTESNENERNTIDLIVIPRLLIDFEKNGGMIAIHTGENDLIQRICVNKKNGWHGIDFQTGLPRVDGKNHNGYSGLDRFLWIKDVVSPWIAAPVHFPHIPSAPYMNIALFFHLKARFNCLLNNTF